MTQHIAIGVLTYNRNELLRDCVASLGALRVPDGVRLSLILVDNSATGHAAETVEALKVGAALPITYVPEPRKGIVYGRNAAIEAALEMGADYLAYTDDDCAVDPEWLIRLYEATRSEGTLWSAGRTLQINEKGERILPVGGKLRRLLDHVTGVFQGKHIDRAATNNVLFHRDVFERLGHRFDLDFNARGSSDYHISKHLASQGHKGAYAEDALVFEAYRAERSTFGHRVHRFASYQSNHLLSFEKIHGRIYRVFYPFVSLWYGLSAGLVLLFGLPLMALPRYRGALLRIASKRLGRGLGILRSLFGWRSEFYAQQRKSD